jgi:hypothetical protein
MRALRHQVVHRPGVLPGERHFDAMRRRSEAAFAKHIVSPSGEPRGPSCYKPRGRPAPIGSPSDKSRWDRPVRRDGSPNTVVSAPQGAEISRWLVFVHTSHRSVRWVGGN